MTTPNLAKIERVDLREAWPNEARDFTPWLAANIAELGEALGMDLELQDTEAAVGGYSLDVLAIDVNRNRPVIIENQLEATDHTHLGQLLTYAAGYDANVVVWLTREFRDEHRQALDWLNQRTGEDTQFFGVTVELCQIGNSLPAPRFNLVAAPNLRRKERATRAQGRGSTPVITDRGERYRQFFQTVIDALQEKGFTGPRKAGTGNWYSFPAGVSRGLTFAAALGAGKEVRVELYIGGPSGADNIKLLENLERHNLQIESELGPVDWQRLENRKGCRIALTRSGSIEDGADSLVEIQEWIIENLLKFKRVLSPHLTRLAG